MAREEEYLPGGSKSIHHLSRTDPHFKLGGPLRRSRDEWVDFIKTLGDKCGGWDWFGTWTFRNDWHPLPALKRYKRMQHYINLSLHGPQYKSKKLGVSSILAIEYQQRDVIHFHTLDGGTNNFKRYGERSVMQFWERWAGFARVYPYRTEGGAEEYVSKILEPWNIHKKKVDREAKVSGYILKEKSKNPSDDGPIFLLGPFTKEKSNPQRELKRVREKAETRKTATRAFPWELWKTIIRKPPTSKEWRPHGLFQAIGAYNKEEPIVAKNDLWKEA